LRRLGPALAQGVNRRTVALLALAAFVACVAIARWDLVEQAARMTVKQFARGGAARGKLLFEIALFAGILGFTLRVVPLRVDPRVDLTVLALAAVAGWCAEAWGTRLGLWTYYTRETPPLWIVPAWSLGALVIDRMSDHASRLLAPRLDTRGAALLYGGLVVLTVVVFAAFSRPVLTHPATVALAAALLAGFAIKPDPKAAVPVLLTGFVCVFFADLWGTTNHCWRYHLQHPNTLPRLGAGIGFGMVFDTAVVFLCLRLGKAIWAPRAKGPNRA